MINMRIRGVSDDAKRHLVIGSVSRTRLGLVKAIVNRYNLQPLGNRFTNRSKFMNVFERTEATKVSRLALFPQRNECTNYMPSRRFTFAKPPFFLPLAAYYSEIFMYNDRLKKILKNQWRCIHILHQRKI